VWLGIQSLSCVILCIIFKMLTDGDKCSNSLKWSTVINLTCSGETKLRHETTNFTLCTHVFNWQTPKACEILVIIHLKNEYL